MVDTRTAARETMVSARYSCHCGGAGIVEYSTNIVLCAELCAVLCTAAVVVNVIANLRPQQPSCQRHHRSCALLQFLAARATRILTEAQT